MLRVCACVHCVCSVVVVGDVSGVVTEVPCSVVLVLFPDRCRVVPPVYVGSQCGGPKPPRVGGKSPTL